VTVGIREVRAGVGVLRLWYARGVATDDESTQPIDIDALRSALPARGAAVPPKREADEVFTTDEYTVMELRPASVAPATDSVGDDEPRSVLSEPPPSSVTRLDVTAFGRPEEDPALTVSSPSTSRFEIAPVMSLPGTVPAHALVEALVAGMGPRSEHVDLLSQTAELESTAARSDETLGRHLEPHADTVRHESTSPESHDERPTMSRVGRPSSWGDVEVTSVSPRRVLAPPSAPRGGPTNDASRGPANAAAHGPADTTHPAQADDQTQMGRLDEAEVRAAFAAAEADEETAMVLNPLYAPAARAEPPPPSESSIVEVDSLELESEPDVTSLARTNDDLGDSSAGRAAPFAAAPPRDHHRHLPAEPENDDTTALPRFAMASMDDLEEELAPGDQTQVLRPGPQAVVAGGGSKPAVTEGPSTQRLSDPAVTYRGSEPAISDLTSDPAVTQRRSDADIILSAHDVEIVSGATATGAPGAPPRGETQAFEVLDDDDLSYDDEGGATLFQRREPAPAAAPGQRAAGQRAASGQRADETKIAPPKRATMAPAAVPYQPPAAVGRASSPAYANDTDDDEDQLQREGSFGALLDLYRLRLADADSPMSKAVLLHKIASVYEHKLNQPEPAFSALVEAFDLRPGDDDIVASLDRVAREAGRVGELVERARKNLHTADHELKTILLGHLVYWYERVLGRPQEMSPFLSELERLDKTHPVALRRAAQMAAANGDLKSQRELLLRALDRTARRDEKVQLHIALAGAHAGTSDALKHYESAVANDPSSIVALQGLERIGREQGKHPQVEWCLERQVEVALTETERIDALVKLADLHETKYLKRERAAEILERILELEPSHPQAMKALERCYHALRDWPRLARVLRLRANNTYDKKAKVELLELAAEVFESKLGDPAAAVEVHRDLLVVDPTHRRALADLARLYEKLGDWGNMSTYKARVAEQASTKRQASQLLVQLGDFLAAPERDEIAARLQYERAVAVDPTNAAAWEALQRVAVASGDDRRVAECLEQRARNVESPRQRAGIFVELANVHLANGAERAAREAFERAAQTDPTNEVAAVAMLDVYTREEKWAEVAPLCDLLVNAARRDNDVGALFTRLRLATRIGAALGNPDRAMTSALAALDIHPEDQGAQADLIAVCSQCRDQPRVVTRAKDWLTRIKAGPTALPATVLLGLALIQKDAGEVDQAAATLELARKAEPDHPEVLKELADVYLAQGDFPRCCKLKVDMARNALSADARFQLLCDAGEIWARRAEELDKAATVFEEARALKPLDHWLLHTLMWLYGERHRWDDLSKVLESIAQIQESPEKKAKSLFAMAQVVEEKVGDLTRAAELFDQVLDIDKKRLDAFERLVRALTEAKDWQGLERSYRKMIGRIKDDAEPNANLQFALFHQLGLIYRDRLEDAEHAYEALVAAARLRPDDAGVRKIVTELLVVTDNLDNAVARTRELIERDPHDAELYSELYELFLRQHAFDKAWCAVNVLAQMREPSAEQARFHADYAPMPLGEVPGQIVEKAWRSHVLHADLDPTLTALFAYMTPAVARMRHGQLRPEQLVYAVGRPFTSQHSRLHDAIRKTFANAAEILHMVPPELLLGDPSATVPFAPALAPFGAVHVGVQAVEARADALVYVIGKRLAEQRSELIARAFFPAVSDLTSLLAAAVRVSRQEGAKDAAGRALDASLSAILMPQERDGIRQVVMQAQMVGGLVDVKRWSQAADLSSMRAGLLLSGDVGPARKTILAEPQSTADLPPREKIGELYRFATSDLYADLRGAIGVAVQD
jgi:tetratricopeptide (TPR) repeat protein